MLPKDRWIAVKWEGKLLFQRDSECVSNELQERQAGFSVVTSRPSCRLVTKSLATNFRVLVDPAPDFLQQIFLRLSPMLRLLSSECLQVLVSSASWLPVQDVISKQKATFRNESNLILENDGTAKYGYFSMLNSGPKSHRSCTFAARCRSSR